MPKYRLKAGCKPHGSFVSGDVLDLTPAQAHSIRDKVEPVVSLLDQDQTLREDGPTIEEYVAAGYHAGYYPPEGYAERPSEGLTRFKATGSIDPTPAPNPAAAEEPAPQAEPEPESPAQLRVLDQE